MTAVPDHQHLNPGGYADGQNKRWLTVKEIAADLDVSTSTIYKWSSRGQPWFPRSIRLRNGDLRIRADWYEQWLNQLEDPIEPG